MEAYDIGAIFSLYIAAFVVFQALSKVDQSPPAIRFARVAVRVGLIAGFAAFLSTEALVSLIGTQISGIAGTEQTPEASGAVGFFHNGFRRVNCRASSFPACSAMRGHAKYGGRRAGQGGAYGKVGEPLVGSSNDPGWSRRRALPQFFRRRRYAGVLVVAVALGVPAIVAQKDSVLRCCRKLLVWGGRVHFRALEFGRYARSINSFTCRISTSKSGKFTHPFNWSLVILFAYGIHGLCRRYFRRTIPNWGEGVEVSLGYSWRESSCKLLPSTRGEGGPKAAAQSQPFSEKWVAGSVIARGDHLLGLLIYALLNPVWSSICAMSVFLITMAAQMPFSIREVGFSLSSSR